MISSVRRWVSEYLSRMVRRAPRREKWSLQITQGLEQRTLLSAFSEFVDPNPAPGNGFGSSIVALSTGNVVVTSPFDDAGGTDAGAVYLFNGATGALISTLRGSNANDRIGWSPLARDSIIELSNGNYLVCSIGWHNGTAENAGAVTWGSGTAGVNGVVSAANSLVGSHAYDQVGDDGTIALSNGNYVVNSKYWDNGTVNDAGAVTWGNGTTGVKGVVSASNSLVGSQWFDSIGRNGIAESSNGNYVVISGYWTNGNGERVGAVTWGSGTAGVKGVVSASNSLVGSQADDDSDGGLFHVTVLSNGNYVVVNDNWYNGAAVKAGAVTWGSGTAGVKGVISAANSLVGSQDYDQVGGGGITALPNGNYVVRSQTWDKGATWDNRAIVDAGAVTWGSGTVGVTGVVSATNSLVGSHDYDLVGSFANDQVGGGGITVLSNGNYVVRSENWDNGTIENVGAATWGNGTTGITGLISASNSLIGSQANDYVGIGGITALSNGNYVVGSTAWNNASVQQAGAATWGSGTVGVVGVVSAFNSLVGSRMYDSVGGVYALSNGNYVVNSWTWNNGAAKYAGAVTWGSGTIGTTGVVSAKNSLVGSQANDFVGAGGITALSNGSYLVNSWNWNNGTAERAGAVTWGSGTIGITGVVSAKNSLVGSQSYDYVGYGGITALSNGSYVVYSSNWSNGAAKHAGAVTWGSGTAGVKGVVSASNSLVGSQDYDQVGASGVTALTNGNYVVQSVFWNNGSVTDAGAVTWGSGTTGVKGVVSASNSLVGSQANDQVGSGGVVAAPNGSYVVISPDWDNGAVADAGAVTWRSETFGVTGVVDSANSLVGLTSSTNMPYDRLSIAGLDRVNKSYLARFLYDGGGRIRVGSYLGSAPTAISLTNSQIAENSANGSVVGTLSATDPNVGDTLTFTLVDSAGGRFGVSGSNLVVANGSLLNYEASKTHSVKVRVTDAEGLTFDKVFTVTVLNVNEVPSISAAPQVVSLGVNSANGTTVATVTVDEIDVGDKLTYSLTSGNSLGAFAINSAGVIRVADRTKLDLETTPTFTLTVQVSDSLNQTATTTVTVNLVNLVGLVEYTFLDGTLRVVGTTAPDAITVRAVSGLIQIEANGSYLATGLAASTVTSIEVFGGGGSDALTIDTSIGSAVNSYLLGGEGNDTLTGGLGNDTLEGGAGNDQLDGQGGFDTANYALASSGVKVNLASSGVQSTGGAGNDKVLNIEGLIGSAFNDVLTGNSAANQLIGLDGNDTLNGGAGDDSLLGGSGNDYLTGGLGTDSLDGGDNNDTLVIDNFDTSVIGGAGVDKVTMSGVTAGVTLNLTSGQIETVQATSSTFNNDFDATGATWAVNIAGGAGNDTILGGNMNDTLNGGAGDDSMSGGSGNDYLTGGQGADALDGGDNSDTLLIDNLDTDVIGGAGIDKVTVTGATAGVTLNLTSGEIETVQATSSTFNNVFDATGATWAVNIAGGSGSDLLTGGNLNDTLNGGAGDDTLIGNLGNDFLTGGIGIDTISYQTASGPVTVNLTKKKTTGAAGTDTLNTIENVIGSLFSDSITGDAFNNLLDGGDLTLDNDTILGGGGTDSIINA